MFHTIIVVGNLGKEPELRYTPSGQPVVSFPVASNRRYTGQNGQNVQGTIWFRVSVWGKQAEACNEHLHKGQRVLVEGHLNPDPSTGSPRVWEFQNRPTASYEITATTVRFLSQRTDGADGETEYQGLDESTPVDNMDIPF
jgi:single-strand DNA-binding protein